MSAIVGIFTSDPVQAEHGVISRMMSRMRQRATGSADVWRSPGATLAVARHPWENTGVLGTQGGLVRDGQVIVAADASLYYTTELRHTLERAKMRPAGDSPAHLIAAAYRVWGDRIAEQLEGDFAFVLWDADEKRVVAARDFGGKRPLHYAQIGGMLIVASTIGGVLAHPACPEDFDLRVLAETASGLFATDNATCYRAIFAVPAGHDLVWRRGAGRTLVTRHWRAPSFEPLSGSSFEDGAAELRDCLTSAVLERLAADSSPGRGATSVWLSGGWDSTAVFAAGKSALRRRDREDDLRAVSMSYPQGDPGREDEIIDEVAKFWNTDIRWIDIGSVGFLGDAQRNARTRDEPFAHAFEMWLRALARGSRAVDSRVVLDGSGGDQLFQTSLVYLADLLRGGRLMRLAHEWRAKGMSGQGFRPFFRWAVQPLLPDAALHLARAIRGRPLYSHLDRRIPSWMDTDFASRESLEGRARADSLGDARGGSRSGAEARWYLTHPLFPKVFSVVAEIALEEGVESRSPLLDDRVIQLAATRPTEERSWGPETKRLLRQAMKGLLPETVLAPRARRTGITGAFFDRSMRAEAGPWITALFREPRLAELGMISREGVHRGWENYLRTGDGTLATQLYFTIQTELWLRARESAPAPPQDDGVSTSDYGARVHALS
ncbi:MAG TPA: asparagine synthase-related protein [Gemmatimonadaceae bacterium]|nr:asparagine synthase-related protein [Gemmatimonadaceae bacterium]